jgi:hypothetical protein
MMSNFWTRKGVVLTGALAMLACVAALLSVDLTVPDPVASAALGAEWQCSRVAFVLTSCTPVRDVATTATIRVRKDQPCPWRRN